MRRSASSLLRVTVLLLGLFAAQQWVPPASASASSSVASSPACIGFACRQCIVGCHCSGKTPYCLHDVSAATSRCVSGAARPLMPPLFFVHMPKTGGTSFRMAVESLIGRDNVCVEYEHGLSPRSKRTVVHKEPGDEFLDPAKSACRLFAGHVHADTYVGDFGLRRTAVFLREPVARIVSWYHHVQRVSDYQASFEHFVSTFDRNVSSKVMIGAGDLMALRLNAKKIPLAAFGFVGVTERYAESTRIFNDAFALDLEYDHENVDPAPEELPADLNRTALLQQFSTDMKLYSQAHVLLSERVRIVAACRPYAHGGVDAVANGTVRGWAWWAHSDDEVEVAIVVGDVLAGTVLARSQHRLAEWGAPRYGYVGFDFQLPGQPPHRKVCVFVKRTGQYLGPNLRQKVPITDPTHPCNAALESVASAASSRSPVDVRSALLTE